MKRVLVPTDFSNNALDALTYAVRLFDDISCTFYILNSYQVSASKLLNVMHRERDTHIHHFLKKESKKELKEIGAYIKTSLLNNKHEYKLLSKLGSLTSMLKKVVLSENIDLIVMGTTGATGAKEIFMGSNTVHIIQNINLCPVLSIPINYEYAELEQVVFPTDFKRAFSAIELNCLIELQYIYNFTLRVIHIKKENNLDSLQIQNLNTLKQFFEPYQILFEEIETNTTIEDAISTYSAKHKINMICLLNYEHNFIEKLTHEPIIKRISFHTTRPLLIIPV